VKVPWVNGLSIEQATVTIESAGLTIAISGDSSNPAYGILSQAPDGASEVAKSSVVTVNVGESAAQQKEREDAAAVAHAAADEAARVEAEPNRSPSSAVAGAAVAAGGQCFAQARSFAVAAGQSVVDVDPVWGAPTRDAIPSRLTVRSCSSVEHRAYANESAVMRHLRCWARPKPTLLGPVPARSGSSSAIGGGDGGHATHLVFVGRDGH